MRNDSVAEHAQNRRPWLSSETLHTDAARISPLTVEDELLIACLRSRPNDTDGQTVKEIVTRDIGWDYVVRAAVENRISSLLYENLLLFVAGDAIPPDILNRLRAIHVHTVAHKLITNNELLRILGTLEGEKIDVMLLKGAALELILKQKMNTRPMSDIDVLIRERDFCGVRGALSGLGYSLSPTLPDLNEGEIVEYAHYFDQIKFFNVKGIKIDLHFRLINMGIPAVDERVVWSRSARIGVDGASALVPSPEDMLIHLCFHANHHRFAKLYYFCDIDRLVEHCANTFDWDYLVQTSGHRNMHASMYYALLLTNRLLGSSVPSTQLERLRPRNAKRALFEIVWFKGMSDRMRKLHLGNLEGPIYSLLEMDGLRLKVRFARNILFPPQKWLSHRYRRPESIVLSFMYLLELLVRCRRAIGSGAQ